MKNYYQYVPGKDQKSFIETYKKDGSDLLLNIGEREVRDKYTEESENKIEELMDMQIDEDLYDIAIKNICDKIQEVKQDCIDYIKFISIVLTMVALILMPGFPLSALITSVPFIFFAIKEISKAVIKNNELTILIDDMSKQLLFKQNKDRIKKNLVLEHLPYIKINAKSLKIFKSRLNNNLAPLNYKILENVTTTELENIIEYLDCLEGKKVFIKK